MFKTKHRTYHSVYEIQIEALETIHYIVTSFCCLNTQFHPTFMRAFLVRSLRFNAFPRISTDENRNFKGNRERMCGSYTQNSFIAGFPEVLYARFNEFFVK